MKQLAVLFVKSSETTVITQICQYLRLNGWFYCLLTLVNVLRFSIQGMGFSQLAMLAGLMEMLARGLAPGGLVPGAGVHPLHPSLKTSGTEIPAMPPQKCCCQPSGLTADNR